MLVLKPLSNISTEWPRSFKLTQESKSQTLDGFELLASRIGADRLKEGLNVLDAGAGNAQFLSGLCSIALTRGYKINPFAVDRHLNGSRAEFETKRIPFHEGSWLEVKEKKLTWPKSFDVVNLNAPNGVPAPGEILGLFSLCNERGLVIIRYAAGEEYLARRLVDDLQNESVYQKPEVFYCPDLKLDIETYPQGSSTFALGPPILIKKPHFSLS